MLRAGNRRPARFSQRTTCAAWVKVNLPKRHKMVDPHMQMLGVPSSNLSANQLGTLPTEVHERGPARGWHFLKTQVINHLKLLAYFQPILHCKVFGLWTSGFPWCPSVSRLCPNCVFLGRQHHRKVLPNILYIYSILWGFTFSFNSST